MAVALREPGPNLALLSSQIILKICRELTDEDISQLRLTCGELELKTQPLFKKHFTSIRIMWNPVSLSILEAMSRSQVRDWVQEIKIGPEYVDFANLLMAQIIRYCAVIRSPNMPALCQKEQCLSIVHAFEVPVVYDALPSETLPIGIREIARIIQINPSEDPRQLLSW